jgi:hypothetical protein
VLKYLKERNENEGDISDKKLQKWATFGIKSVHHARITGTVYDDPRNNEQYLKQYADQPSDDESPKSEIHIPLNPPIVPKLILDDSNEDFIQSFEEATNFILYAAEACQRLRINEEISRRSKLRWFSALADIYDEYKLLVEKVPTLKSDKRALKASQIAEYAKKDKSKKGALAKEVMAGRRINKILESIQGQWHLIDLLDFITKDFLVNNNQEFIEELAAGIEFDDNVNLPYMAINSGSSHQFAIVKKNLVTNVIR